MTTPTPENTTPVAAGATLLDISGDQPPRQRQPTITAVRTFPADAFPLRIIWGDGDNAYAVHQDGFLMRTQSSGVDWVRLHSPGPNDPIPGYKDVFMPIPDTDLQRIVAMGNAGTFTAPVMQPMYSADGGRTWTNAASGTLLTGDQPLGATSMGRDPNSGHLYFGAYLPSGADRVPELRLWRSTDQGVNWSVFHVFPGMSSTTGQPVTRHIHSITWDQYSQRLYLTVGDLQPGGGIYRVTADGTGVEPVLLNTQVPNYLACAIDLMFFPNHIVWGTDNSSELGIFRMARDQIGATNPQVEKTFRTNSSNWWAWPLDPQGTRWMMSGSNDSAYTNIDTACHLYIVGDEGLEVHEVGTVPGQGEWGGPLSVQCVGPRDGKSRFWMNSRFFSSNWSGYFAATMSTGIAVEGRDRREIGAMPTERLHGTATVDPGSSAVLGHLRVPRRRRDLVVFDMGRYIVSGPNTAVVEVWNPRTNSRVGGLQTNALDRAFDIGYQAPWWTRAEKLDAGDVLLLRLTNTGTTSPVTVTGFMSYRFERSRRSDYDWSPNSF